MFRPIISSSFKRMSNPYLPDSGDVAYENQLGDFTPVPPTGPLYISGMMIPFAGPGVPANWYLCDGQLLSQAANAELFAVIGSNFNQPGDPVGQFRVPDMRGRSVQTTATLYEVSGATDVVLDVRNLPQHQHTATIGTTLAATLSGGAFPSLKVNPTLTNRNTVNPMTDQNGNAIPDPPDSVPIMNPFLVMNWIIKK